MKSHAQKMVEALLVALQPEDDKRIYQWTREWLFYWAALRTMSSKQMPDGSLKMWHECPNEEFMQHAQETLPLKQWIDERKKRSLTPFKAGGGESVGRADDISEMNVDEILNKFL